MKMSNIPKVLMTELSTIRGFLPTMSEKYAKGTDRTKEIMAITEKI